VTRNREEGAFGAADTVPRATPPRTAPCWYVDRDDSFEVMHFATEAEARADAEQEAGEDDNPPHEVRRHDVPCRVVACRGCDTVFHVLDDGKPITGLCGEC
jgi:hypothetical protein